jgi:hypothetical protein
MRSFGVNLAGRDPDKWPPFDSQSVRISYTLPCRFWCKKVIPLNRFCFSNNSALAGDAGSLPNEFPGLFGAPGIRRIVIAGGPLGGTFVMDDLTQALAQTGEAPEPGTLPLVLGSLRSSVLVTRSRTHR